ncbi:MAG: putative baseplate assembly protein [Acidobacteria bacterium]|nr:putative baseplate assembly protein [Acidobacteriota bacterium]
MKYFCCDDVRRQKLKDSQTLNGIDFIEVVDSPALPLERRQRTLLVSFLSGKSISSLKPEYLAIDGGTRIKTVGIAEAHTGDNLPAGFLLPEEESCLPGGSEDRKRMLVVRTDSNGDFSAYTFRILRDPADPQAPSDFDPILSAIEFRFKAGCPSDFDCLSHLICPTTVKSGPDINYLAKDYAGFRQLMLDRMALLIPAWEERSPADLGITLIEWMAAIGDQLSYRQDAVATEAYLGTARRRVSVRRHARLVDYHMHDGCNARAWIHITVEGESPVILKKGTPFLTADPEGKSRTRVAEYDAVEALQKGQTVFEAMHDLAAFKDHNRMRFYTWGNTRCCLPAGATKATLLGHLPNLKAGDVVILAEVMGPNTGRKEDADPGHRHPVRLSYVLSHVPGHPEQPLKDPLYGTEITEIEWAAGDALPFPICISSVSDGEHGSKPLEDVSEVLGNIVPADHGAAVEDLSIKDGDADKVPEPKPLIKPNPPDRCRPAMPAYKYPKFSPSLERKPLTAASPYPEKLLFDFTPADPVKLATDLTNKAFSTSELDPQLNLKGVCFQPGKVTVQGSGKKWSVSDGKEIIVIRRQDGRFDILRPPLSASETASTIIKTALPAVTLFEKDNAAAEPWIPVRDLLNCTEDDRRFVVEMEDDETIFIRFGDNGYGMRPRTGTIFKASYRIGNGSGGNVGADTLIHIVSDENAITAVTNPLSATGGMDPESIEQVRQKAPFAFRVQERAVTAEDYAEAARKFPGVQNAVACFRWTGSWHTVFLTIDRKNGMLIDDLFREKMLAHLERYRLAGYDLVLDAPRYVSLEIDMRVCVKPGYFCEDVKEALLDVFSNGRRSDGRLGLFHPDQYTFGQPVYLSRIYEAAMNVDGVRDVHVTRFQRKGEDNTDACDEGRLVLGRLEIARLDNDPSFPDHGILRIEMGGGQ